MLRDAERALDRELNCLALDPTARNHLGRAESKLEQLLRDRAETAGPANIIDIADDR